MKFINKYKSPNFNNRKKNSSIDFIIIHYTAMRTDIEALNFLTDKKNKVSSHFLINKRGKIYKLVDIKYRAWHAGLSCWKNIQDINSKSIGIEIDNSGHLLDFENYTKIQITSLIKLLKYLVKEYNINYDSILGHSDIAPYRKIDPGEKFPWHIMLEFKKKKIDSGHNIIKKPIFKSLKKNSLYMLCEIGYDTSLAHKNKKKFIQLIKIFQMHHRRSLVSGLLDYDTYKIILKKFNELLTI